MTREVTSKNIDGITDLVVIAPIKAGFIDAYENITYATRLKLVAEALNRVRVTAREHERITPYSDVTERILTLLDFRVGVLDNDLFSLQKVKPSDQDAVSKKRALALKSQQFLYLTATFDGAWEPYMRLIWDPLGPFLDLLFCNCEGYVTATEHSFEEYAQWVRDNQVDSAIFYATTSFTIRDQLYLSNLERLQRGGADAVALAESVMPYPEDIALKTRSSPEHLRTSAELGLEALTVLYKLADYYPPQWLTGRDVGGVTLNEGQRLAQVARDLLLGWDDIVARLDRLPDQPPYAEARARWHRARKIYAEPLHWYETGRDELKRLETVRHSLRRLDRPVDLNDVQGGIIQRQGSNAAPVRHGALLLFTIRDTDSARNFLPAVSVQFAAGPGSDVSDGLYRTIGFTPTGLLRLGLARAVVDRFPKEFREGMAARSGLFGDMRENHPRNWILPERNGPAFLGLVPDATRLPPVEPSEVDLVVQIRSSADDVEILKTEVSRVAKLAGAGASLEAIEWLESSYDPATGMSRDQFGFADGVSQPWLPVPDGPTGLPRDRVALGEILLGYGNDRGDSAPGRFDDADDDRNAWRHVHRERAQALQRNGSFLVLRKIGQDGDAFESWTQTASATINATYRDLTTPMTPDRLKALVLGRSVNGDPLIPASDGSNDFDYSVDAKGHQCPFASHVRRANPRKTVDSASAPPASRMEFHRPTPRILRRGMGFAQTDHSGRTQRGLMFMAYNASIAEQYETIQRWLNGGNSTDIASAHNDPLTGVQPKSGPGVFRFIEQGHNGPVAVSVDLPPVHPGPPPTGKSVPGRHPFAPLHWGMYLFVPSRHALTLLAGEKDGYRILDDPLEIFEGQPILDRLEALEGDEAANGWKRLLEDFDVKDPAMRDLSPSLWALLRSRFGGAMDLRKPGTPQRLGDPGTVSAPAAMKSDEDRDQPKFDWQTEPEFETQNVILVAGRSQVRQVLADWQNFTVEEQLRRIKPNSGPIFVTQQPDNQYNNTDLANAKLNYPKESFDTNKILLQYTEEMGFDAGYAAGTKILNAAKTVAQPNALSDVTGAGASADVTGGNSAPPLSFKMELRRQYLLPALGDLCQQWYGLPDDNHMLAQGWSWDRILKSEEIGSADPKLTRTTAHCPGDFLSPSRNAFYPRPSKVVKGFAESHGTAILQAATAFVEEHRAGGGAPLGTVAAEMFKAIPDNQAGNKLLARNLIGTMVGAIPPMDGNLRGILLEWLGEKTLWRHQSALRTALGGKPATSNFAAARAILYPAVAQAMCKRPAPDLIYRTAKGNAKILLGKSDAAPRKAIETQEGDLIVVSLVSASQRSLLTLQGNDGKGDVSIVFGGQRKGADQGYLQQPGAPGEADKVVPDPTASDYCPVHACPAQDMAMGAIMGIMAALLDAGTIQALPASMIVKISDWS